MAITETLPILSISCIDLRNASVIALSDLSSYESLPLSANLAMQITAPGCETINVAFTPGTVNIYKCVDLGISCTDTSCTPLPDGIYSIVYTVTPASGQTFTTTTIDQKFIKIDAIRCKYGHAFEKIDVNCLANLSKNDYWQKLRQIRLLIDGSVQECINNNYHLCFELYHKADIMLDRLCNNYPQMNWNSTWKFCKW